MKLKYVFMILLIANILGEDQYYIKIKDTEYQIELDQSETANQIKSKFPLTISMINLNENEVYYNFDGQSFPTNQQSVGTINQGDIYLYQTNCLVLFYKTFSTSYRYTKIGKVINPEGLDTLIGSGNVEVMWFIKSEPEENPKDSSNNNVDSTDNNSRVSDTKKVSDEDEDGNDNNFDNFSIGRFMKLNYFAWLFLSLFI